MLRPPLFFSLAVQPRPFLHQHRNRPRQRLVNPEQEIAAGSQPRRQALCNLRLQLGLEIGEHQVAAQDQIEEALR
jgi:hypothetical protein